MEENSFVSISGTQVHYLEHVADNNTIVFIHGSSMSSNVWEKQYQSADLQKYHLLSIDLPGHGSSPHSSNPSTDYTIPAFASLLTEFVRHKQLKNYFILGLSLGGNIILEALSNLQNAPAGVVLASTAIVGDPADLGDAFVENPALATVFSEHPNKAQVEQLIKTYFKNDFAQIPEFFLDDFYKTDTHCRTNLGQSITSGNFADEIQVLRHTNLPVALIYGAQDQLSNISYVKNLGIAKWQDKVHLLHYTGHMPQWEAPEQFNQILLDFIKDVSS